MMQDRRLSLLAGLILGIVLSSQAAIGQSNSGSSDRSVEFVGWVKPEQLYWRPFTIRGLPDAEFKLLSLNEKTGARSQITRFAPGWRQPQGYYNTNNEFFVLSGDLRIGSDKMTKYSYAYYPAGFAYGEVVSEYGATVLHWLDSEPEFAVSEVSKKEARAEEVVKAWNFYEQPWTHNDAFPKWADFPPSPEMRLKLLRQDKETGQMTWMNFGASDGARLATGKNWEAHPMWEEAMLLEGELTYGECLPQGEIVGTYTPGGYFFRPGSIRHGGGSARSDGYTLFIFRSGESLWTEFYEECEPSEP